MCGSRRRARWVGADGFRRRSAERSEGHGVPGQPGGGARQAGGRGMGHWVSAGGGAQSSAPPARGPGTGVPGAGYAAEDGAGQLVVGLAAGGAGRRSERGRPELPGLFALARGPHVWVRARERRSRSSQAAESGGATWPVSTQRSRRTSAGRKHTGRLAGSPRDSRAGPGAAGSMVRAGHAGTSRARAAIGGHGRGPQQAPRRIALDGEQDAATAVLGRQ